jgi:hypothetical protein
MAIDAEEENDVTMIGPMDEAMEESGLNSPKSRYAYWAWVNQHKLVREFARRANA